MSTHCKLLAEEFNLSLHLLRHAPRVKVPHEVELQELLLHVAQHAESSVEAVRALLPAVDSSQSHSEEISVLFPHRAPTHTFCVGDSQKNSLGSQSSPLV